MILLRSISWRVLYVFFNLLYDYISTLKIFSIFWLLLVMWDMVTYLFFCFFIVCFHIWLTSFPTTTCWRDSLCSILCTQFGIDCNWLITHISEYLLLAFNSILLYNSLSLFQYSIVMIISSFEFKVRKCKTT